MYVVTTKDEDGRKIYWGRGGAGMVGRLGDAMRFHGPAAAALCAQALRTPTYNPNFVIEEVSR